MRRTFKEPRPCKFCGNKAKKLTRPYWSNEPYRGNLHILKQKTHNDIHDCTLWDGETYYHNAGFFCKNKCAIEFANDIITGKIKLT